MPQKPAKAKLAGPRGGSAKPDVPLKRRTRSTRFPREEPNTGASPLSKSCSGSEKGNSRIASVPIKTSRAQNKSKSNTRLRKLQKRKLDSSTPAPSPGHNKKRSIQSGPSSLSDVIGQPLTKSSRSLAQPPNIRQPLSEEALEAHTRIAESAYTNQAYLNADELVSHPFNQNIAARQTPDDSYVDPQEAFNRKWGYLPPFDEESEQAIAFIINNPALAKTMARIQPGTLKFGEGLQDRNVALKPSNNLDKCKAEVESLQVQDFMNEPEKDEESHELLWKLDQAKITASSSEALFQRTIMVSLIARHFLIYSRDSCEYQLFDFGVEEPWTCLPMPSRALNGIKEPTAPGPEVVALENKFLTQPKPDLAIAFNRQAIMTDETWETLPRPIQTLASFEKADPSNFNIFHFLILEAKNPAIPIEDRKALHQCLNCVSQALFNLFEFFRDAGSEYEKLFFEKVRVFSIVANRTGLLVRIHRAVEIPKHNIARRVIPRDPNYLLKFEFEDFTRIEGIDKFDRSKVLEMLKKILKYAKDTLRPLIKDATSKICWKLETDINFVESRTSPNTYRHGQPGIGSSRGSRRSTPAPSANGAKMDFLQYRIHDMPLSTNGASSVGDESMRSGQATPKASNNRPRIPSKLGLTGKKRKASAIEAEDFDHFKAKAPKISKCGRAEASDKTSCSQTRSMTGISA